MLSEFSIIEQYFKPISIGVGAVVGIGDDGAVISLPVNKQLVVVTDTSIAGVHFPTNTPAFAIGWKSLAVNLSDLAAIGATPAFFSLALSLPKQLNNEKWLAEFAKGIQHLANQYNIALIGGDTTKSAVLSITITANGWVENNKAILRSGAIAGDLIYISGNIGDAGLGLKKVMSSASKVGFEDCIKQLNTPEPQIVLGQNLLNLATSAIDVSDGLLVDLKHILKQSKVSATINYANMPFSIKVKQYVTETQEYLFPLTCGDDYQLCFTIAKDKQTQLLKIANNINITLTCIGEIVKGNNADIYINNKNGTQMVNTFGYKHF